MPRKVEQLGVWLGDARIAVLEQRRRYEISCRYTDQALERWAANLPVVSCSLPVGDRREDALPFCRGLLPEGRALEAAAQRARVSVIDVFALLAHFGRDIAGALVISDVEPVERHPDVMPYVEGQLDEEVENLPDRPLALHDDSELSLDGLQNKLLLVRLPGGGWARPVHGYPSTHILKTDDARHPGLVEAEAACLDLARAVALTTVATELLDIGDTRCLIVSRFDRRAAVGGALPARIHQEDICQATAIDPSRNHGRAKYQRHGGPSFTQIAGLLNAYAADPQEQLDKLVAIMTFNVLIGNADAHGKNLALLHEPIDTISLAPLYDTVPTLLWPKLRSDSAMSINHREDLREVAMSDIVAEASSWGYSAARARRAAETLVERALAVVSESEMHTATADLVRARGERLSAASPGG